MKSHSILVVEDEAIIALGLCDKLEEMGYEVVGTADTGEKAIRLASQTKPDLMLMDICIKGPMDGIDTAAIIRRDLRIPIVFLTSFADSETIRRAAQTAPYGYLTKPYKAKELRAAIEVALQKAALEVQLQDSERWFASTLRCTNDGVVVADKDGNIRFLNPAAEKLLGRTVEDVRGRRIDDVVQYADGAADTPYAEALRDQRVVGIVRARPLRRSDGSEVPVDESAAPMLDEAGNPIGIVVMLRDATLRTQQEQRLQTSDEQFRKAFGASHAGMALVSMSGKFLQVNEVLAQLLGYTPQELRDRSQDSITCPEDIDNERVQLFDLVTDMTPVAQFEKRYLHKNGERQIWVMASVSLMSEQGEPVCYTYQVHDISHRKTIELERARLAREAGQAAHSTTP